MEGYLSEIRMFAGNFAPRAWMYCEGQLLPISSNTALFSLLGTTYGGDGRTTFGLPDLRGRHPIHPGHGPGLSSHSLGQKGGAESVTLNLTNMPSHNHLATGTVVANSSTGSASDPTNAFPAGLAGRNSSGAVQVTGYSDTAGAMMAPNSVEVTVSNAGGNIPFSIMNPYLAMNYIICTQGIFPSRG